MYHKCSLITTRSSKGLNLLLLIQNDLSNIKSNKINSKKKIYKILNCITGCRPKGAMIKKKRRAIIK